MITNTPLSLRYLTQIVKIANQLEKKKQSSTHKFHQTNDIININDDNQLKKITNTNPQNREFASDTFFFDIQLTAFFIQYNRFFKNTHIHTQTQGEKSARATDSARYLITSKMAKRRVK